MANYNNAQVTAQRLIAQKGFVATFRTKDAAKDPVTGLGGAAGATRTVNAVKVAIDQETFEQTLAAKAACVLLCDGPVDVSDTWVDGSTDRPVIATKTVSPDNATHLLTKALIGG